MTDTAPIRPEERFDEDRVADHLRSEALALFGHGPIGFDQFPGGAANLTYRATTSDGREFVLRRAPLGAVAKSGHDMEREYRVLSRLWKRYPLAPRAHHFCADPEVMGKPFFVMERRSGHVIRDRWPDEITALADGRRRVARSLVDGLAELHGVEPAAVGLEELGRPSGFVERQVEGWARRWHAAKTRDIADIDAVITRLQGSVPEPDRATILHNDYKLDNAMVGSDGELVAVFDWDMATLGDPLVDVGTLLAYWATPDDPTYPVFGDRAVAIGDVMSKDEVRSRYSERTGADLSSIHVFEGLALFRIAVIIEQIYARYVAGQTSDERFASFEPLAPLLASAALAKLA